MLLDNILNSGNKLKLLRELSLHENWNYNINELAKNTDIHRVRISSLIKELADSGVIKIINKGKVKLISINKENYFVKNILIDLFDKENNLALHIAQKIADEIKKEKGIVSIILFGSAIKNKFTFKSDLDLMIIINKEIDAKYIENIIKKYSNGILISYDIINIAIFKKLFKEKEASIVSLIKDNKTLYGKDVLEVI
ncbi:MAG: nucleotidyltransferase domain-containing protein [Candidatus Nanoarchaeia archaeon]|nr:nucleotidyltransferase domain-containing protein [Candidatus Nanoarchaeia archaeon]